LGQTGQGQVSRYELFQAVPTLEIALALELILGVSPQELFAGIYDQIGRDVRKRAKQLAKKLYADNLDTQTASKLDHLRAIIIEPDIVKENPLSLTSQ
jgi:transcriptional regulator with XRE-family HTH domain